MFPKMKLIITIFFMVISKIQITHAEQVKSKYDDLLIMYQGREESSGIKLEDSGHDVIIKLAMGNFGAIRVLVEYLKSINNIEQGILHPIIFMLMFDSLGITESKIWMLYKDVCHENIVCVHTCIRSVQLGMLQKGKLYFAIENRGAELDIKELFIKLQARLESFNPDLFPKLPSEASSPDYFNGYYVYGTVIFAGVTAAMFYLYHKTRGQYHRARGQ